MGTDDLRRMCLALPYRERVLLEADLRKANIEERKRPRAEPRRAAVLLKIMEETIGSPVLTGDRKQAAVWGRTMVAYQLAIEGMPVCEIARQMLKDHATVIFMRRKMADALALPRAYSDIIEIWDRFQEKIGICSEGEE